ncbi:MULTISPECIES: sigma-70 family RNA polymerase sigma factor [unclassified Lysinibacillus]|uniref:sigma-70 family RNA polymerase sigma factor n=1 Tax=unclassified Lysinibacillus TaxID=2636778 RepID=UPI00201397A0|nr:MULTISPECIES: sigma-70 family RNA polymerase sigma factor [unclassified Lysinibacillus]MCL1697163.1 sigma-70 family RNA polymerase sigma factor [Lysinibacillus sp. BPa_S21]MCL1701906.1 sigma-70 family RNA polymerase sigma factor [Lysinibacillus sp. Bpr_S20]
MDLAKLVKKAKKGDDEAFEQLIGSVRQKLYRTAYAYVRNEQDALDVYQETIYTAYISIKTLKKPESFSSWITKILVFKSIDFIRKESRHFTTDNEEIFTELIASENVDFIMHSMDLSEAFKFLNPTVKTIILLRYYHDLSIKEIATIMNYPEGTVKSHLNRAKKELRPILKEGYLYE